MKLFPVVQQLSLALLPVFVALFLVILAIVFLYRRHKAMQFSGKKRESRGLLDGEEFDNDERNF